MAALFPIFASGCAPIVYTYDPVAMESFVKAGPGVETRVVYTPLGNSKVDAVNAARRACGLDPVSNGGITTAVAEMKIRFTGGLANRHSTFECPVAPEALQ